MATWTGKPHTAEVIAAAKLWRERCLAGSSSVFSGEGLWTLETFQALKVAFVDKPLFGPEAFIDKLKQQLNPAEPKVKRLAAECLWLLFLFVSGDQYGEDVKRGRVRQIWELGGSALPQSERQCQRKLA